MSTKDTDTPTTQVWSMLTIGSEESAIVEASIELSAFEHEVRV